MRCTSGKGPALWRDTCDVTRHRAARPAAWISSSSVCQESIRTSVLVQDGSWANRRYSCVRVCPKLKYRVTRDPLVPPPLGANRMLLKPATCVRLGPVDVASGKPRCRGFLSNATPVVFRWISWLCRVGSQKVCQHRSQEDGTPGWLRYSHLHSLFVMGRLA